MTILKRVPTLLIGAALLTSPLSTQAHASWMTPYAQISLGNDCMNHHEWSDAVYHFRLAVAMNYRSSAAHCGLGYAYLHRADIERARTQFEDDLRLHPHSPAAEKGLQLTLQSEQDRSAYLAQLRSEVTTDPHNADAIASIAEELFDQGNVEDATAEANNALAIAPKLGHAHCVLGHIALARGDDQTAKAELDAAIAGDKNDDDAWGALGDIAMTAGDYRAAIDDYKHSISAFPEHREWHEKLASAYQKNGDTRAYNREESIIAGLTEPLPQTAGTP